MDNILVTVILTTYNRPVKLARSLKSVMNQTYKNLEILVVDGAGLSSTENMVSGFKYFDDRIIYIDARYSDKTAIYGDVQWARNLGLANAHGKYVAMLDDDDYWRPHKIEQQLFYAEIYDAALTSCFTEMEKANHVDKPNLLPKYKDLLKNFNMSCTSSYFLNRKILNYIGAFDESLRSMHEYDIALKLARRGYRIYVVQKALMVMNRDNTKFRGFYFIKIAEIFDLYRLYGKDMLRFLGVRGLMFNVIKSFVLMGIFLAGFVVKERVWGLIYKLKNLYQEKSE